MSAHRGGGAAAGAMGVTSYGESLRELSILPRQQLLMIRWLFDRGGVLWRETLRCVQRGIRLYGDSPAPLVPTKYVSGGLLLYSSTGSAHSMDATVNDLSSQIVNMRHYDPAAPGNGISRYQSLVAPVKGSGQCALAFPGPVCVWETAASAKNVDDDRNPPQEKCIWPVLWYMAAPPGTHNASAWVSDGGHGVEVTRKQLHPSSSDRNTSPGTNAEGGWFEGCEQDVLDAGLFVPDAVQLAIFTASAQRFLVIPPVVDEAIFQRMLAYLFATPVSIWTVSAMHYICSSLKCCYDALCTSFCKTACDLLFSVVRSGACAPRVTYPSNNRHGDTGPSDIMAGTRVAAAPHTAESLLAGSIANSVRVSAHGLVFLSRIKLDVFTYVSRRLLPQSYEEVALFSTGKLYVLCLFSDHVDELGYSFEELTSLVEALLPVVSSNDYPLFSRCLAVRTVSNLATALLTWSVDRQPQGRPASDAGGPQVGDSKIAAAIVTSVEADTADALDDAEPTSLLADAGDSGGRESSASVPRTRPSTSSRTTRIRSGSSHGSEAVVGDARSYIQMVLEVVSSTLQETSDPLLKTLCGGVLRVFLRAVSADGLTPVSVVDMYLKRVVSYSEHERTSYIREFRIFAPYMRESIVVPRCLMMLCDSSPTVRVEAVSLLLTSAAPFVRHRSLIVYMILDLMLLHIEMFPELLRFFTQVDVLAAQTDVLLPLLTDEPVARIPAGSRVQNDSGVIVSRLDQSLAMAAFDDMFDESMTYDVFGVREANQLSLPTDGVGDASAVRGFASVNLRVLEALSPDPVQRNSGRSRIASQVSIVDAARQIANCMPLGPGSGTSASAASRNRQATRLSPQSDSRCSVVGQSSKSASGMLDPTDLVRYPLLCRMLGLSAGLLATTGERLSSLSGRGILGIPADDSPAGVQALMSRASRSAASVKEIGNGVRSLYRLKHGTGETPRPFAQDRIRDVPVDGSSRPDNASTLLSVARSWLRRSREAVPSRHHHSSHIGVDSSASGSDCAPGDRHGDDAGGAESQSGSAMVGDGGWAAGGPRAAGGLNDNIDIEGISSVVGAALVGGRANAAMDSMGDVDAVSAALQLAVVDASNGSMTVDPMTLWLANMYGLLPADYHADRCSRVQLTLLQNPPRKSSAPASQAPSPAPPVSSRSPAMQQPLVAMTVTSTGDGIEVVQPVELDGVLSSQSGRDSALGPDGTAASRSTSLSGGRGAAAAATAAAAAATAAAAVCPHKQLRQRCIQSKRQAFNACIRYLQTLSQHRLAVILSPVASIPLDSLVSSVSWLYPDMFLSGVTMLRTSLMDLQLRELPVLFARIAPDAHGAGRPPSSDLGRGEGIPSSPVVLGTADEEASHEFTGGGGARVNRSAAELERCLLRAVMSPEIFFRLDTLLSMIAAAGPIMCELLTRDPSLSAVPIDLSSLAGTGDVPPAPFGGDVGEGDAACFRTPGEAYEFLTSNMTFLASMLQLVHALLRRVRVVIASLTESTRHLALPLSETVPLSDVDFVSHILHARVLAHAHSSSETAEVLYQGRVSAGLEIDALTRVAVRSVSVCIMIVEGFESIARNCYNRSSVRRFLLGNARELVRDSLAVAQARSVVRGASLQRRASYSRRLGSRSASPEPPSRAGSASPGASAGGLPLFPTQLSVPVALPGAQPPLPIPSTSTVRRKASGGSSLVPRRASAGSRPEGSGVSGNSSGGDASSSAAVPSGGAPSLSADVLSIVLPPSFVGTVCAPHFAGLANPQLEVLDADLLPCAGDGLVFAGTGAPIRAPTSGLSGSSAKPPHATRPVRGFVGSSLIARQVYGTLLSLLPRVVHSGLRQSLVRALVTMVIAIGGGDGEFRALVTESVPELYMMMMRPTISPNFRSTMMVVAAAHATMCADADGRKLLPALLLELCHAKESGDSLRYSALRVIEVLCYSGFQEIKSFMHAPDKGSTDGMPPSEGGVLDPYAPHPSPQAGVLATVQHLIKTGFLKRGHRLELWLIPRSE